MNDASHAPESVPPADPSQRLARRLLALEESHTFLARTLDELSGEVLTLGTALQDLARRVDRLDERVRGVEADPDAPPGADPFDDFGAGPDDQP